MITKKLLLLFAVLFHIFALQSMDNQHFRKRYAAHHPTDQEIKDITTEKEQIAAECDRYLEQLSTANCCGFIIVGGWFACNVLSKWFATEK